MLKLTTPPELVRALEAEIANVPVSLGKQVDALSELFHLFTEDRDGLSRGSYLDIPKLRTAYLRYHLPLNVARASWVLADVIRVQPKIADMRDVADLGAGLGSASLASLFGLPTDPERAFWLFDRSRAALKTARGLMERCAPKGSGRVVTKELRLPVLPAFPRPSLVWLAMVLNEIDAGSRRDSPSQDLLGRLADRLPAGSVVLAMEPALRAPGRKLLQLHDWALASGAWRVIAPCTHQLQCPLLRLHDRPWCHFKLRWDAPKVVRDVAVPLRLDHTEPSLAYLALEKVSAGKPRERSEATVRPMARVIGDPMPVETGRLGVYICVNGGRDVMEVKGRIERGDLVPVDAQLPTQAGSVQSTKPGAKSGAHSSGGSSGRPPRKR